MLGTLDHFKMNLTDDTDITPSSETLQSEFGFAEFNSVVSFGTELVKTYRGKPLEAWSRGSTNGAGRWHASAGTKVARLMEDLCYSLHPGQRRLFLRLAISSFIAIS